MKTKFETSDLSRFLSILETFQTSKLERKYGKVCEDSIDTSLFLSRASRRRQITISSIAAHQFRSDF